MTCNEIKEQIEKNKKTISDLLSGNSFKRLNSFNWLRHELSNETRILFQDDNSYFNYINTTNLGTAWDYILENKNIDMISTFQICKIHSILCKDIPIKSGLYRENEKYLELYDLNGHKIHTPHYTDIPKLITQITYNLINSEDSPLVKAFNIHYDLIKLQPFEDFNKRTARMIMNWVLIQNGYRPIIFNKRTDKTDYMQALRSKANGDCKSYSRYLYSCLLRTQCLIIKKLKYSKVQ